MTTKPARPPLPLDELRQLAAFLAETGLEEVEVNLPEGPVRLKRPGVAAPAVTVAAPAPAAAAAPAPTGNVADAAHSFTSPMVGTFYGASSPDAAPFVSVGDTVKQGQALCIIEAMKTMNRIESDRAGTVRKILVSNATPVEFGQPLFVIS